jgi:hypothetical protein
LRNQGEAYPLAQSDPQLESISLLSAAGQEIHLFAEHPVIEEIGQSLPGFVNRDPLHAELGGSLHRGAQHDLL